MNMRTSQRIEHLHGYFFHMSTICGFLSDRQIEIFCKRRDNALFGNHAIYTLDIATNILSYL